MPGATLPKRMLGNALKKLRLDAGYPTIDAAAKDVSGSANMLWRWENAAWERPPKLPMLAELCKAYGQPEEVARALEALAKEPGTAWWNKYADAIHEDFDHYLSMESAASAVWLYHPMLVPGLFQTADYRRKLIEVMSPDLTAEVVDKRIEIAAQRQKRLGTSGFGVHALFTEAALRGRVGNAATMLAQLRYLADLADRSNVSLRVVPQLADVHPGLITGPFTHMQFPPQTSGLVSQSPMVFLEQYSSDLYLGDAEAVGVYRDAHAAIGAVALSEDGSRDLILSIVEEYSR